MPDELTKPPSAKPEWDELGAAASRRGNSRALIAV